jgi:hypothetical protein
MLGVVIPGTVSAGSAGTFRTAGAGLSTAGSTDSARPTYTTDAACSANSACSTDTARTTHSADAAYSANTANTAYSAHATNTSNTTHTSDASNAAHATCAAHEVIVVVHVDVGRSPSATVTPAAAHPGTHHESEAE